MATEVILLTELTATEKQRFWAKVNMDGPPHPTDTSQGKCWLWTASIIQGGYGGFNIRQKTRKAHRISFFLANGFDALPLCMHSCDRPRCVNPRHLSAGTSSQNAVDMFTRGRGVRQCGDMNFARRHPELVKRGEKNGLALLTDQKVREIRTRYATGRETLKQLAPHFGVTFHCIWRVVKRKSWAHVV